jgi:predicted phosphodiesterase
MALLKVAFLPDAHRPYHDQRAWDLFLAVMDDWRPDTLICMGDLADNHKISRFTDAGKFGNFESEVNDVNDGLDELDSLSATRKIFIEGNHEDRLSRYLAEKAPALFPFVTTEKLFKLSERGWEFVPYKTAIQLGKLWITHDIGATGRYSLFRAADTFQHPVVVAHTHRIGYIVEGNATGEYFPCANFGWLGDVSKVSYMHQIAARRYWALGFGTGLLDEETG